MNYSITTHNCVRDIILQENIKINKGITEIMAPACGLIKLTKNN